jgi:hypothetical protein
LPLRNDAVAILSTGKSTKAVHAGAYRRGVGGRRREIRKERDIAALFHQSHPLFALFHLKAHHEMAIYRFAQCARLKSTLCECQREREREATRHSLSLGPCSAPLTHSLTHSQPFQLLFNFGAAASQRTHNRRRRCLLMYVCVCFIVFPAMYLRTPMFAPLRPIAGNEAVVNKTTPSAQPRDEISNIYMVFVCACTLLAAHPALCHHFLRESTSSFSSFGQIENAASARTHKRKRAKLDLHPASQPAGVTRRSDVLILLTG